MGAGCLRVLSSFSGKPQGSGRSLIEKKTERQATLPSLF